MQALISSIVMLLGSLFLFLGALGIIRMPDVYNRMQTGTKATTLGSMLFMIGLAIGQPDWVGKFILLIGFIMYSNPISSHALARASHFIKVPIADDTVRDCLLVDEGDDEAKKQEEGCR